MIEKKKTFQKVSAIEKGITLIALAITIVILIILATVAINAVFNENGLIKQAEKAKDLSENSTKQEEQEMANLTAYMNELLGETGGSGLEKPTLPDGWDGSKVTPIESAEGITVPVPKGYTASSATGEKEVNGGFVIYEGDEAITDENVVEAKTRRNQFVWVPVDDINKIANLAKDGGTDSNGRTNYQGKLYNFSTSGATEMTGYGQGTENYREPDILTEYDGIDAKENSSYFTSTISTTMTGNQFKKQLQEEYNEMIASVSIYGGFYIGRYETGNLASNTEVEPVVVKGREDIADVNWYYMYQNSKKIAANGNVVSTMIWGSMWDRTLIWLTETNENTDGAKGKSYAELNDARNWGNYSDSIGDASVNKGTKQKTGNNEAWKANNIYDLAGNVFDSTLETYQNNRRVVRGGICQYSGSEWNVFSKYGGYPSNSHFLYGSRSALYIK